MLQGGFCILALIQTGVLALQATQEASPPSSTRAKATGTWCVCARCLCWTSIVTKLNAVTVHADMLTALAALLAQVGNNFPVSRCSPLSSLL